MSPYLPGALGSEPICCLLGHDKFPIYVHRSLISQSSPSLWGAITDAWTDWSVAVLPDIEPDAFKSAMEYLYTGSYTESEPVLEPYTPTTEDEEMETEAGVAREACLRPIPSRRIDAVDAPKPHEEPRPNLASRRAERRNQSGLPHLPGPEPLRLDRFSAFERRITNVTHSLRVYSSRRDRLWGTFIDRSEVEQSSHWLPRPNKDPREDYAPVFLSHAKAYELACRYGMSSLRELALQRLRLTLAHFTLFAERVDDIHALVEYTARISVNSTASFGDRMLEMVLDYCVCHLSSVMDGDDFDDLLKAYPRVANRVASKLADSLGIDNSSIG